jgi:hypothetical protein
MTDAKGRPVLLVGSVPLVSSRAVFEAVGTKLGKLVKRVPDGETGMRKDWIGWQADVFKNAKGLEPGNTRELQGGYRFILYKAKPGETVEFGSLGYAAAAIRSYEDFKQARSEGKRNKHVSEAIKMGVLLLVDGVDVGTHGSRIVIGLVAGDGGTYHYVNNGAPHKPPAISRSRSDTRGLRRPVRHARQPRGAAFAPALFSWEPDHRGRLATVPDLGPLRCRVFLALQVQSEAYRRLSQPVELYARALSGAGRR